MRNNFILLLACLIVLSCSNNNKNNKKKSTLMVTGTKSDVSEPWLALRDSSSYCSNLIGKLPDGTLVELINEDASEEYVEVRISSRGFVNKRFLTNYQEAINNPKEILEEYTRDIFKLINQGKLSSVKNFIRQDYVKFFRWDVSKCMLSNDFVKRLTYDYSSGDPIYGVEKITGKKLLREFNYTHGRPEYKGVNYFPSSGFGGGSVMPNDKTDEHLVVISKNSYENSDQLWFIYKISNNQISLVEIGNWSYTP